MEETRALQVITVKKDSLAPATVTHLAYILLFGNLLLFFASFLAVPTYLQMNKAAWDAVGVVRVSLFLVDAFAAALYLRGRTRTAVTAIGVTSTLYFFLPVSFGTSSLAANDPGPAAIAIAYWDFLALLLVATWVRRAPGAPENQ